jgi:hypothetical protein
MIRVVIVNSEGKQMSLEELSTAAELQQVVNQARNLIRDCERLAHAKGPQQSTASAHKAPYS